MASYAPLLAHADAWQWKPDLIWFDNLRAYGTPSYYVQQLFSRNRGDVVLPVEVGDPLRPSARRPRLYATACREDASGAIILKLVNAEPEPVEVLLRLQGPGRVAPTATALVLADANLEAENSFEQPRKVAPRHGDGPRGLRGVRAHVPGAIGHGPAAAARALTASPAHPRPIDAMPTHISIFPMVMGLRVDWVPDP